MDIIATVLLVLIQALVILLFVYALLSFIVSPYHPIRQALGRILEPFLNPIRQLLPQSGPLDFSVMVLFIVLFLLRSLIEQIFL
jgi:YggT family protein